MTSQEFINQFNQLGINLEDELTKYSDDYGFNYADLLNGLSEEQEQVLYDSLEDIVYYRNLNKADQEFEEYMYGDQSSDYNN